MSGSGELTAADMIVRLRVRYSDPEWAFLEQVRSSTGYSATATADALAMGMYPSRGCEVHGFEVKVSRPDLLRELKIPDKAAAVATHCDRWWIVAPRGVCDPKELPATWGLLSTWGDGLRAEKDAPLLHDTTDGLDPLPRTFVAAILRRAMRARSDESKIAAAETAARKAGYADGKKRGEAQADSMKRIHETLLDSVRRFEKATGLSVTSSRHDDMRMAVQLHREIHGGEYGAAIGRLRVIRREAQQILSQTEALVADPAERVATS